MKPYMVYSREGGSCESASLAFAHTVREAKRIAWPVVSGTIVEDYPDLAVTLLKDADFHFSQADKEKIKADIPHVIFAPVSCPRCNMWGYKILEDGICENCHEEDE